ncbi:MAG TPA: hypothetical protein VLG46_14050, partial [Anaerolineae bacterium]|nr:hypothetical protein [Anaerolineae bacterium]
QDYRPPGTGPDVAQQLNWLGQALRQGAGESTQGWYPEGYFFMHAIYGAALITQALLHPEDTALRQRNTQEVAWALNRLESAQGHAPFPQHQAVEYGVFYLGWSNRLLGGWLSLQSAADRDAERVEQFHRQSAALAQAFRQSPTHHLEAYPGGSWPVDNVVALTSLRLHDDLYGTNYAEVIDLWLAYARIHLEPATGLLPHRIDAQTGELQGGARASSLVMALCFLGELDADFAHEQYARLRELYAQPVLDFVLLREYPRGVSGPGDVDSGPLLGDISPIASGVALAAARLNGDEETFERLLQLSEVVGLPTTMGDQKWFSLGWLPVGDAFLVWGKTIVPWRNTMELAAPLVYPRLTSTWYACTNGLVLFIALGLGLIVWRKTRPARSVKASD